MVRVFVFGRRAVRFQGVLLLELIVLILEGLMGLLDLRTNLIGC